MSCSNGCGRSRRTFLEAIGLTFTAVALGLSPTDASALPVSFDDGTPAGDAERRYPVPPADGVTIDRKAQLILVRYAGRAYAFNLACPHENTALRWLPKDGRFQCPKHGSRYQPNGTFIEGRATRNMDRLPIRRDGDALMVDTSRIVKSDSDPSGWAQAYVIV
ncbi:MAG TPA: Rieske (2Fe-2S) protein [Vicinamibacterales bacterium]|nr:Rieske (2Fe-2S) protein [Vicinamibacterales bacterium]